MKKIFFLIAIIIFGCSKPDNAKCYFFGDSHFSRLDANWWFPNATNINLAVGGTRIEQLKAQFENIEDQNACCFVEVGTNNFKSLSYQDEYRESKDSFISQYKAILTDLSLHFQFVYLLSVIPVSEQYNNPDIKNLGLLYDNINKQLDSLTLQLSNVEFIDLSAQISTDEHLLINNLTTDYVHLNNIGYQLLTGKIREKINNYENK